MAQQLVRRFMSLLLPLTIVPVDEVHVNSLMPLQLIASPGTHTQRSPTASTTSAAAASYHEQYIHTRQQQHSSPHHKQHKQHLTKLHNDKRRFNPYGQYTKHKSGSNNNNNNSYGSLPNGSQDEEKQLISQSKYNEPTTATTSDTSCTEDISNSSCSETTTTATSSIVSDKHGSAALTGRLLLTLVAFLYGTLNVALRQLYALPGPPSASALSTARGWLAALSFLPILLHSQRHHHKQQQQPRKEGQQLQVELGSNDDTTNMMVQLPPPLWVAALELAVWNFGAQGLINVGLLYTESARASFLTQTSVVLTPLLSMLAGQPVGTSVWFGCALALSGLLLLSSGGEAATSIATASDGTTSSLVEQVASVLASIHLTTGDWLILGGALSWSMYLFRMSHVGSRYPEVSLQALKNTLLAALYTTWFLTSLYLSDGVTSGVWDGWQNWTAWAILAYSAAGPGAIADVLQQQGQKEVSATEANIILSAEPIFTAICAYLLLGEVTTARENAGGTLIVLAALVAARG